MSELTNGPAVPGTPYPLGAWVPPKDQKDERRYKMSHFLEAEAPRTAAFYNPGTILDQGQHSSCVGHAGRGFELMDPGPAPPGAKDGPPASLDLSIPAIELYKGSQDSDEWNGSEWEDPKYEGSSLHGLAKYMQAKGTIQGAYAWASSPQEVTAWLRTKGPVIFASKWTEAMFKPDSSGFVHATGAIAGGHAYRVFGVDEKDNWICPNNWGTDWGISFDGPGFHVPGGVFKIAPADQQALFADHDAEGFSPVKISSAPPTPDAPYYPSLPRTSLTRYSRGDYGREVVVTRNGVELARSIPKGG